MMLRCAERHGALSGDGAEVNLSCLPEAARQHYSCCKRRATEAGTQLVANCEPVPTDVHVRNCFNAMKRQQQQQRQPGQERQQLQQQALGAASGSASCSGGAAGAIYQGLPPQQPQPHQPPLHATPQQAPTYNQAAASQVPQQSACSDDGPPSARPAGAASASAAVLAAAVPLLTFSAPAAKPPRPGPGSRMQQTPAHLRPLQRTRQPAPAPTSSRSQSPSPAVAPPVQARAEPPHVHAASAHPAAAFPKPSMHAGAAFGSGGGTYAAAAVGAPIAVVPSQPFSQPPYTSCHYPQLPQQPHLPHPQQLHPQPLQQHQPYLQQLNSHQHQHQHHQQLHQQGLPLGQPLRAEQRWRSGAGPAGYQQQAHGGARLHEDPQGRSHAPLPATSVPPPATAATEATHVQQSQHHQEPHPATATIVAVSSRKHIPIRLSLAAPYVAILPCPAFYF